MLVVDDNRALQQLAAYVLKSAGLRVVTAGHGLEALEVLAAEPETRLVITDLEMPHLDGFGLLHRIREQSGPPTLIVTARGRPEDVQEAARLGAAGVVKKPFSRGQLLAAAGPFLPDLPLAPGADSA
ncbi:hypothetical protein GCM10008939_13340 [Deinococcus aquiradiocola]|uniref:Response regulatory domain-containing protein n=1 Tax=Deinococcus aquiradiocola TaxID=393059 RepID=A0A917PC87_9DEIO|nr:hypothetical protein GCM10008939_13340 [Deinococcus aquiradiocola]